MSDCFGTMKDTVTSVGVDGREFFDLVVCVAGEQCDARRRRHQSSSLSWLQ